MNTEEMRTRAATLQKLYPWMCVKGGREKMAELARTFPTMVRVPGTDPWDAVTLAEWHHSGAVTGGSGHAARFLLAVWGGACTVPLRELNVEPFDMVQALRAWDDVHHAAFAAWCKEPFFP